MRFTSAVLPGLLATACLITSADAGVSFSVTYSGFDIQQQQAFQAATDIWSSLLPESYAGETIRISASLFNQGPNTQGLITLGSTSIDGYYLMSGGSVFANTAYATSLADHLEGSEITPGASAINMSFNTNSLINWYYGTDGKGGSQRDFITVVVHEIGHGLGISSGMLSNGQYFLSDGTNTYPTVYDQFLEYGGVKLVSLSATQRQAALVSGSLYWDGSNAVAANSGSPVQLYAPSPYVDGSSVSHLDETAYTNDLMSPIYSGVDHTPSAMDLGMLRDMGWSVVPEPTVLAVVWVSCTALSLRARRGHQRRAVELRVQRIRHILA